MVLKVNKNIQSFSNPLNAFSIKAIFNAIVGVERAFLKQFNLSKITAGFELEFYFFSKPTQLLLDEISRIPFLYEVKSELGDNQYEVTTVPCTSLLELCDMIYIIRHQIDVISNQHNNRACFSAVFNENQPPSGMQFNVSVNAIHTSLPLSHSSIVLMRILQNMMSSIGSMVYIACPTVECIQRVANHNFVKKFKNSPTHITWGMENRTVAVRLTSIPNSTFGSRIEHRLASPLANPYHLALAIMSSSLCPSNVYFPQTFIDSIHSTASSLAITHLQAIEEFTGSDLLKKMKNFCKKNAL